MRTSLLASLVLSAVSAAAAQRKPPNTDVFLAPITVRERSIDVGKAVNITSRPGYDNQPSFTPDGKSILYTSTREDAQADIYRYDLRRHTTTRLTTSAPESEYSATVMPNGRRFSVIRVERDSTQRLWSFDLSGRDPKLVLTDLKPVGYHAWLDSRTVAAYVLGTPNTQNTLYVANLASGGTRTVAHDVGRSLVRVPGRHAFSFLQHADSAWFLEVATVPAKGDVTVERLVRMPAGADYVVWTRDGTAITATGAHLLIWRKGVEGWIDASDLSSLAVDHLSRLALSPDERLLAFVAEPK